MRTRGLTALLTTVALGAMLVLSGCGPTAINATSGPLPDTVTAVGSGTGSAAPDRAEVSFGVTARAKTSRAAQDTASKAARTVLDAVKAGGAAEKDLQTQQISLDPQRNSAGAITGYTASQSVRYLTKDVAGLDKVIAAATAAGATDVSGPQFTMGDTNTARLDAITKAMADAKARAGAMAKAAGRALGPVVSVTEAPDSTPGPIRFAFGDAKSGLPSPAVEPGQLDAQAQVTVVFSLK